MTVATPDLGPSDVLPAPFARAGHDDHVADLDGGGIDFRQIFVIIRRNIVLIAAVIALALVIGLIATLLTTPKYVATASVQIDQEAERVLNTEDRQPAAAYQDADRFLQTQTDILRSRSMAIKVAQTLHLMASPSFFRAMDETMPTAESKAATQSAQREATIKLIMDHLAIDLQRNSRVATISFESPEPDLSAQVANTYAKTFIASNLQRKYDSTSYAREFLSGQLAEAKAKLEQSERQLNDYARQAGLIKTSDSDASGNAGSTGPRSVTTADLVQTNSAANEARTARIAAEQKWKSVANAPLLSIPDVLSNLAVQQLLQKRAELQAQLEEESARHRAAYPTVMQLRAQVDELSQQINTIASNIRTSIRDQYVAAQRQEQALEAQVNQLKGATLAEQDRSVQYNILAREADTNRTLYDGLLQRYKEVSAQSGVTTNNISIVDQADPPIKPSSPKLGLNLILALVIGAAVAAGIVFIREQMDDAVRAPDDIERKLGLSVLGVVPRAEGSEDVIAALEAPRSPVAEAYHALRASLLLSSVDGLPRSLLITSSQAGEGKSTTSYAIASDMARLGKRTVLIDVDLRRPNLHRLMGTNNDAGVSTVLTHQATLASVLRPTEFDNLHFISSGPIPPSPTELLGSPALAELVGRLQDEFDLVVLDGPPVLGLADAPILATVAESTALVVESNRGHRGATKSAVRRLQATHANLIGAILTKFEAQKAGYGYAYGYDYYHYGTADDRRASGADDS